MMVLRAAALYGHDPGAPWTGAEMLVLRGIHPTVEAAQAAIEHANATPASDKPEQRRPVRYWMRSVRIVLVFGGFLAPPSSRDMDRPHAKLLAAAALLADRSGSEVATPALGTHRCSAGSHHDQRDREGGVRRVTFGGSPRLR